MVSTPHTNRYRSENDPYNEMDGAITRPDYLSRKSLSDAEKTATKSQKVAEKRQNPASASNLRQSEQNQTSTARKISTFANNVRGKEAIQGGKSKGKFKKFAPITAITGIIFGGGAFFLAAQSFLAPHLSSLYTQATDVQFTSYSMRNQRLFKFLVDGGDQLKISIGGFKKYTTFTPYMKQRLKNNGIEVGYLDSDGIFRTDQLIATKSTVLKYGDDIIDADAFQSRFAADTGFRDAYYKAKRGRVAGFFDDSAEVFYKKHGATRDIFNQYKSTGDQETDIKNFQDTVSDRVTTIDSTVNTVRRDTDEETGDERIHQNGDDVSTKNTVGDTPEAKARSMVNSIAGKVSNVGMPVCAALRIANIAAITVSAFQIFKSVAYFLSLIEPASKMMAGQGDASAVNEMLNFLTTSETTENTYVDDSGKTVTETVTGSALTSAGSKLVLGDTLSSKKDVQPYSINNITRAAQTIAISSGATTTVCSGVLAASAIVSLASNAVPGGTLATVVVGAIAQTVGNIAITAAVSAIIGAIVPYVAKVFSEHLFDDYKGVPAGELYSLGAANANFGLATQSRAYMPASEERVKTQNQNTVLALADEAELDRYGRSPFDTSSENTFLGSLLSNFSYFAYSNSLSGVLNGINKTLSSSIHRLSPASYAADQDLMYTSNYEECDNLPGTVCDMYGINIPAYDYTTIDITPDDPTYNRVIAPNLKDDGETIKDGSELAKFINFCVNRESPWGVTDANILNALQTDGGIILNNAPITNDIIDVINAAEDAANQKWATGEICINSADNPRWDNEFKYYQLYVNDMSILDGMDDGKNTNAVLKYEQKYAEEHPVDTSFQGTLARISGQTKEDIAYLIEVVNYSNFLAQYDPSSAFNFHNSNPEPEDIYIEDSSIVANHPFIIQKTAPIFFDKRNFTV